MKAWRNKYINDKFQYNKRSTKFQLNLPKIYIQVHKNIKQHNCRIKKD